MNNIEFLKEYNKITVSRACRDLKISRANLMSGRSSTENSKKVVNYIKNELLKLLLKDDLDVKTDN